MNTVFFIFSFYSLIYIFISTKDTSKEREMSASVLHVRGNEHTRPSKEGLSPNLTFRTEDVSSFSLLRDRGERWTPRRTGDPSGKWGNNRGL